MGKYLLALVAGLLLVGCSGGAVPGDKKVVVATFTVLADMVQNVAGDKAIVISLTKVGAEIHSYEPTPSDLVRAQGASVILKNGLGLEAGGQRFFHSLPRVPVIAVSEGINTIDIEPGKPDPHAWLSPRQGLVYVENIRRALISLDPPHATTYNQNAANYKRQIQELDKQLSEAVDSIPPDRRFLVTCEGAFSYLARDYGLRAISLWSLNTEQQGTPRQIEKVIATVKAHKIPAVFCESTVSQEAQMEVVKATGAKFGGVFYVDSLSAAEGEAPTYLKLLQHNMHTLMGGLQAEEKRRNSNGNN